MSNTDNPILRLSVRLEGATAEHRLVTVTGAVPTAGGHALGPVFMAGRADEVVAVTAIGVGICVASAAVAAGATVVATATGKVKAKPAAEDDTSVVIGRALEAAGADGDEIRVLLIAN